MFDNIDSFMLCGLYIMENNGVGCVYVYMEVVCVCVCGGCVCMCTWRLCVYVYMEVVGQNISCRLRLFRRTRVQPSQHSQQHNYHPVVQKGRIFGSADLNVPKPKGVKQIAH